MGVFKRIANYGVDRTLKILAIVALTLFIFCSLSWLVQRPNRYQLIHAMTEPVVYVRMDTLTGKMEYIAGDLAVCPDFDTLIKHVGEWNAQPKRGK